MLQTALSLARIAGAGIMITSLQTLLSEGTGYDSEQSVFLWPDLFNAGITREQMHGAYTRILSASVPPRSSPALAGLDFSRSPAA